MKRVYRVGIAGVVHGHVTSHIRTCSELPQTTLVAVADPNTDERDGLVARYGLQAVHVYNSVSEMLDSEELDIVSVCTTTADHARTVEAAASHGIHCVVEKPLAFRLADADRMYAAAGKYTIQVATNYPSRWDNNPISQALRFVKEGGIGRPYEVRHRGGGPKPPVIDANTFFEWLYQPLDNGAGAFADYSCYGAELACDILGSPVSVYAVVGRWARTDLIGDDNARLLLQYPQGVAVIEATWSQIGKGLPASTLFNGDEGTLALEPMGITLYSETHREGKVLEGLPSLVAEPSLMAHLVNCLDEGMPVAAWAGIGAQRAVTEVMDAGLHSAETGAAVRLPLPLPHLRG